MTTPAEVTGIKMVDGWMGEERREVTLKLWGSGGELTLRLKPHEAKPYTLGRMVDVTIQPRKN